MVPNERISGMDWKSFGHGIVSNAAWWGMLLISGFGMAYLKANWPSLAGPLLYGLLAAACIFVIHLAGTGRSLFSKRVAQTTVENLEANIRSWLDSFHLSAKSQPADAAHFLIFVTMNSGHGVLLARFKSSERYLTVQGRIVLSPEHQQAMDAMTVAARNRTVGEIALELSRARVGHTFEAPPLRAIGLSKGILITSALTEQQFASMLDDMDLSINVARMFTSQAIEKNSSSPQIRRPDRGHQK